ncbi:hypothetical protein AZE42_01250 [Rhizopogon vesiculosus]|uniref:Uncharacterized protein n=1 Tax=Rhizopogon vesiculosus TaxID=180088 RepID=A0A1J8QYX3_9AGAM|nr:hypothetical protein AZE42_01250 [Rhizopogon vesiculosus]
MPVIRTLLVFVPAAAITLLISTPFTVQPALATPTPALSSSNAFAGLANFSARTDRSSAPMHLVSHAMVKLTKSPRAPLRRRAENEGRKASKNAPKSLREPAPTSASTPRSPNASSDKVFCKYTTSKPCSTPQIIQQASTELPEFSTNFKGFTTVLGELGTNKGTAKLDPTNDLEILLKNIINMNKDILTVTYDLVDSFPIVGSILGPIVYEVKCILDDLLDTIENLSDATINAIQPLLQVVLRKAVTVICRSGAQVAGLCI